MGPNYYIGLMSGTSTDGVDSVLAEFTPNNQPKIISATSVSMPADLRTSLLALNYPGNNELARAALASNQLADLYADAVNLTLSKANIKAAQIKAIGAHGQTVRHNPELGYTIQLNAPARLAELCKIAVIADFRSRDIAAQGQGAPLVPAFHKSIFNNTHPTVVLNLGGIANITALEPKSDKVSGFDTGPANVLMDAWSFEKTGKPFDQDGMWAASGKVNETLLQHLLTSEPWLHLPPPKSTGRHLFNLEWLHNKLITMPGYSQSSLNDADIQATLLAFTARTVCDAINNYAPACEEIIVCGGGALNNALIHAITGLVKPGQAVTTSADYNIPVQLVEALAFAWLAYAWDQGIPANLPQVTGASGARLLGCKYPA